MFHHRPERDRVETFVGEIEIEERFVHDFNAATFGIFERGLGNIRAERFVIPGKTIL